MVWGAMSINGTGLLHRINGIMDQHVYVDEVLRDVLKPFAEDKLAADWLFQVKFDFLEGASDFLG